MFKFRNYLKIYFYFLPAFLLVLAVDPGLSAKEKNKEVLLHFVHVSDTHLQRTIAEDGHRLKGSSEKLLTKLVEEINEIQDLDFVLSTGDNVDQPLVELVEKYIEITMSLESPNYVVLGNHDVGVNVELNKEKYIKKFYSLENATSFTNEMTYYSFSPSDRFTFICLDGTTEKEITSNGNLDEEQFEWLKDELEANKDKFVIVALHFPLIEPFKSESHKFLEPYRTKILDLIKEYKNVIGVFTGHYHAARLIKIKNKIHNTAPAIIQYPVAFREVTISKDEKGEYLYFDFKWHQLDVPDLIELSKKNSRNSWKLSEGTPEDREGTIKIRIY